MKIAEVRFGLSRQTNDRDLGFLGDAPRAHPPRHDGRLVVMTEIWWRPPWSAPRRSKQSQLNYLTGIRG